MRSDRVDEPEEREDDRYRDYHRESGPGPAAHGAGTLTLAAAASAAMSTET